MRAPSLPFTAAPRSISSRSSRARRRRSRSASARAGVALAAPPRAARAARAAPPRCLARVRLGGFRPACRQRAAPSKTSEHEIKRRRGRRVRMSTHTSPFAAALAGILLAGCSDGATNPAAQRLAGAAAACPPRRDGREGRDEGLHVLRRPRGAGPGRAADPAGWVGDPLQRDPPVARGGRKGPGGGPGPRVRRFRASCSRRSPCTCSSSTRSRGGRPRTALRAR